MARPRTYPMIDGMKECSKCHETKLLVEFGKSAKASDGHQAECKSCHNKRYEDAPRYPRDLAVSEKECSQCGKTQKAGEFYDDPMVPSGIKSACITCILTKNTQWNSDNPEQRKPIANRHAKKARQDPIKGPIIAAKTRQWQLTHPVEVKRHGQTDRAKNGMTPKRRAGRRKQRQKFFGAHPGYKRAAQQKRRALLKNATVIDAMIDIAILYERDQGICSLCTYDVDETIKWPDLECATIEHRIPATKGGAHSYANTFLAHHYCNSLKFNHLVTPSLLEWIKEQFALRFPTKTASRRLFRHQLGLF